MTFACARFVAVCPRIAGDLVVEEILGSGGGAISDKCSGDIEPFSDSSVLTAERDESVPCDCPDCRCEGSSISPNTWAGIVEVDSFFPLLGFTIGDCRTLRVDGRGCFWVVFFTCLLGNITVLPCAEWLSRFRSIGELVVPESRCSYTEECSF